MIVILFVLGLMFGSFVNALVWRLYKQDTLKTKNNRSKYSISTGRSMCVECEHTLSAKDLIPVLSWILLGGKCRFCKKKISWQYPLVEISTALLLVISFVSWPRQLMGLELIPFFIWLVLLIIFMAMFVYDLRWMILPDRLTRLTTILAMIYAISRFVIDGTTLISAASNAFWGFMMLGGLFYLLYQVSKGQWIGGGDVKLGFGIGILVGGPWLALALLFIASMLGSIYGVAIMSSVKNWQKKQVAFGPFLLVATFLVFLLGPEIQALIDTYLLLS